MVDEIKKAINNQQNIRYAVVDATNLLNEIITIQKTNLLATTVLSRVVLGTILLASDMKNSTDRLSVIFNGKGLIGTIIADYTNYTIRALCGNPQFELPEFVDVDNIIPEIVGHTGTMKVIKDLGLKEPFSSEVPIISGEINVDFSYYLSQSEQIKSVIASTIKLNPDNSIKKAIGFMAQLLPDAKDENIAYLEHEISDLATLTKKMSISKSLDQFLLNFDPKIKMLSSHALAFKCSCSWEMVLSSIKALGQRELTQTVAKGETIQVICEFCRKKYEITPEKIKHILQN